MKLLDPQRPTIQHKPAFLTGNVVIPLLSVFPLGNGRVRVGAMLPVEGEGPFVAKEFRAEVNADKLGELMERFEDNPEGTIESLFGADPSGFVPAVSIEPDEKQWLRDQRRARDNAEAKSARSIPLDSINLKDALKAG